MQDENEKGSWASVFVKSIAGGRATIEYHEMRDDDEKSAVERVKLNHLRPVPPDTPKGFVESLQPGALCELLYEGSFWEVELLKITPAGKYQVKAPGYVAKHNVPPQRLRPAWEWQPGVGHWKLREAPGS